MKRKKVPISYIKSKGMEYIVFGVVIVYFCFFFAVVARLNENEEQKRNGDLLHKKASKL